MAIPSLHFANKMVIKIVLGRGPLAGRGWPSKPLPQLVQWFIKMAFLMSWIRPLHCLGGAPTQGESVIRPLPLQHYLLCLFTFCGLHLSLVLAKMTLQNGN